MDFSRRRFRLAWAKLKRIQKRNINERQRIMKLIRRQNADLWNWSPVEQLSTLREEINRLFDSPFGELTRRTDLFNGWTPALDLYEDKDNLIVKAELPGMKREEIEISVHDGTLS